MDAGTADGVAVEAPALDREDLRSRARWVVIALGVVAIVDVIAVVSGIAEYRLLGTDYTFEEADANDLRQGLIGIVQFLLLIVTAVLFIRWFKRAYENIDPLGGVRRYGTGWAIGAWFVPVLNLWRPKQIANDIWGASTGADGPRSTALLNFWWAAFLLANWISWAALRLSLRAETDDELRASTVAYMVSDAIDVAGAILAIAVVQAITDRQRRAH